MNNPDYNHYSFIEDMLRLDSVKRYSSHNWEILCPADNTVAIEKCSVCGYTKVTGSIDIPFCKEYLMDEALK